MTLEEKCKIAIEKGITYNPITGKLYGVKGKEIPPHKTKGYIQISMTLNKKHISLFGHQLAWYLNFNATVDCIDHKNGIKTDNRIENLRSVTLHENQWNQKGAKGYYWSKRYNKWFSTIQVNGKQIWLGYFNTKEEAREAYLNAKKIYHII